MLGLKFPSFTCAATDHTGNVTSGRVDLNTVILHRSWINAGSKSGAGAAYNDNGMGGAFAVGGWAAVSLSKVFKIESFHFVSSVTWQKDDVSVATKAGPLNMVLKDLAARGTFRFGFGKAW
jgi:hypothetical protein